MWFSIFRVDSYIYYICDITWKLIQKCYIIICVYWFELFSQVSDVAHGPLVLMMSRMFKLFHVLYINKTLFHFDIHKSDPMSIVLCCINEWSFSAKKWSTVARFKWVRKMADVLISRMHPLCYVTCVVILNKKSVSQIIFSYFLLSCLSIFELPPFDKNIVCITTWHRTGRS